MSDTDIPQSDSIAGAPHPRETAHLIGQSEPEGNFLEAYNSDRLHHAWLITGNRGVGKATLAWRLARFLLAEPVDGGTLFGGALPKPDTLEISADHPINARMLALSEPRLFLLRRAWDEKTKKLKSVITVDEARKLRGFFALSAADGGRRVVIVDTADEMNPNAANALLKLLEEPPERTTLFLISHQPSRLLPTIRSRCRELRCHNLAPDEMARALAQTGINLPADTTALSALADGSVGEAVRLINLGGLEIYAELTGLFGTMPNLDRPRAQRLAQSAVGAANANRLGLILTLTNQFLARTARAGIIGPPTPEAANNESAILTRLAPNAFAAHQWAELQQSIGARMRHGVAVNLDPAALILDMVLKINALAGKTAAR